MATIDYLLTLLRPVSVIGNTCGDADDVCSWGKADLAFPSAEV
jgi:hypothetical protein